MLFLETRKSDNFSPKTSGFIIVHAKGLLTFAKNSGIMLCLICKHLTSLRSHDDLDLEFIDPGLKSAHLLCL